MSNYELITSISTERFDTVNNISIKAGIPVNEVKRAIRNIRNDNSYGKLCSRPGPLGGYRYDGNVETQEYLQMKSWVKNWRTSMNIIPAQSLIL